METSLNRIFDFLKENRVFNKELQTRYYSWIVGPHKSTLEKLVSLLYSIANTQSQPKIDLLSEFYKKIYKNKQSVESFSGFLSLISSTQDYSNDYFSLYKGMKSQNGWGQKTSALFAKAIFHLHNRNYPEELKIWNDVPTHLANEDQFYVPVDAVIIAIFKHLKNSKWNFDKINKEISKYYSITEIEIWDDLWFWGFITQSGSGDNRRMQWNLNKYWALRETDKNPEIIKKIHSRAEKFLMILNEESIHRS